MSCTGLSGSLIYDPNGHSERDEQSNPVVGVGAVLIYSPGGHIVSISVQTRSDTAVGGVVCN